MARIDNAEAIRDRAYAIWEREGRPSGREHEHWAEAARDVEHEQQSAIGSSPVIDEELTDREETQSQEMDRLRRALYEPAEFTKDLADDEPFLAKPANDTTKQKSGRRATR